jgi:hypothetical protein
MMRSKWVKGAVFVASVALLLALGTGALWCSRWGRFILGISTFVVSNESATPLREVRVSFVAAGCGPASRTFDAIAPGKSRVIRVHTSDLILDRLEYNMGGEGHSYSEGGIACPGEEFVLSIKGPGQVTTSYRR